MNITMRIAAAGLNATNATVVGDDDFEANNLLGASLSLAAAFMGAASMNVQQLSLSSHTLPEIAKNTIWFFGLMLYLVAQLTCVYALNYAPLTLCAALFTTMLIFDALIARFLLKKHISRTDQLGLLIILGSIITTAFYGPQEEYSVTADCMWEWLGLWTGYATLVSLVLVLLFSFKTYSWFNKKYPHFRAQDQDKLGLGHAGPSRKLQLMMMVIYPTNLAVFETFGQLSLKGVAGMAEMHFLQGHRQTNKIMFWVVIALWLCCVINTVVWLRRVYAKFTTIECLPVEYGLVGVFSIFGSLLFYQEYLDKHCDVFMVSCSCGGILFGIAIMVYGKHKTLEQTRARRIERLHASMVRGAPIKTERPVLSPGADRWKNAKEKVVALNNLTKGIQHRHSMVDLVGLRSNGSLQFAQSPSKTPKKGGSDGFAIDSPRLSTSTRHAGVQQTQGTGNSGDDGVKTAGRIKTVVSAASVVAELMKQQRAAIVGGGHWSNTDNSSSVSGDGRQRLAPITSAQQPGPEEGAQDLSRRLFQRQGGNVVAPAPQNPTVLG
jgi:drug/metabolite transporter (DMT)-like permease